MLPEQGTGEGKKAYAAFCDYALLGAGRSLASLVKTYQSYTKPAPPTKHLRTLKGWSSLYQWQNRVTAYDKAIQTELETAAAAARRAVMESGLAKDYERVRELKTLAELLRGEVFDDDKRWLPDVKQIGSGAFAERVDIVRFNAALIEQYRGALNDIALEVGDRKLRQEVTGANGGPIEVDVTGAKETLARKLADLAVRSATS